MATFTALDQQTYLVTEKDRYDNDVTYKVTFRRAYYMIAGNNGNHTGLNRKWRTLDSYNTLDQACRDLSEYLNDKNGARPGQIGYTRKNDRSGYYGLEPHVIVSPAEWMDHYVTCGSSLAGMASGWTYEINIEELEHEV